MGNMVSFKKEFGLILVGAIIFVASFLWKDLLLEIEEYFFPKSHGLTGRIIFTVVVTVILITIAIQLKYLWGLSTIPIDVIEKVPQQKDPMDQVMDPNHFPSSVIDHSFY